MTAADALDGQFAALKGCSPFGWQKRLFQQLLDGNIPDCLDLPTGLGKTSVMAIWYLALRTGAKLSRRLVYVVDRNIKLGTRCRWRGAERQPQKARHRVPQPDPCPLDRQHIRDMRAAPRRGDRVGTALCASTTGRACRGGSVA